MPLVTAINQLHGQDALLWLLTFSEPNSNVVYRAVSNLEDVVSRGQTFTAIPFEVTLPPDDGQRFQNLQISFANVGRELMQLIREYQPSTPPLVKLELVLSDAPDTVEKTIDFMRLESASYDALSITFTLSGSNIFQRKTCQATYDSWEFPGLSFALK